MKYATYILTAFETEIEKEFETRKSMISYLSDEFFAKKDHDSFCVLTFKLDSEGYKTHINTKYSFEKR